jgi:hypothetical protein
VALLANLLILNAAPEREGKEMHRCSGIAILSSASARLVASKS